MIRRVSYYSILCIIYVIMLVSCRPQSRSKLYLLEALNPEYAQLVSDTRAIYRSGNTKEAINAMGVYIKYLEDNSDRFIKKPGKFDPEWHFILAYGRLAELYKREGRFREANEQCEKAIVWGLKWNGDFAKKRDCEALQELVVVADEKDGW